MTTLTDTPKQSFRLSQLIYDTRYRSITIQVIALILIVAGLWWLVNNIVSNLAELGKDFNFSFLGQAAGYDINQRLIEYNSQMTHGRAALVGILNTLLVAFLGCIAATIIGVAIGVLRLSKNWVVSRLMAVYVEGFRNVPLLLWIILIFAVFSESPPQPRDFRGDDATASMYLADSVAVTNRGTYIPRLGFTNSLSGNEAVAPQEGLPAVASGAADWILIFGVLFASILFTRWNNKRARGIQEATGDRPETRWVNLAAIIIPVGIVLFFLGATIVKPYLKGFNFTEGVHIRNALMALWLALSLYTGAFIAGTIRSRWRAGPTPEPYHEPCDLAPSDARHRSAADFAVLEPYEELITGTCRWIHGCPCDLGWYYDQPNRP